MLGRSDYPKRNTLLSLPHASKPTASRGRFRQSSTHGARRFFKDEKLTRAGLRMTDLTHAGGVATGGASVSASRPSTSSGSSPYVSFDTRRLTGNKGEPPSSLFDFDLQRPSTSAASSPSSRVPALDFSGTGHSLSSTAATAGTAQKLPRSGAAAISSTPSTPATPYVAVLDVDAALPLAAGTDSTKTWVSTHRLSDLHRHQHRPRRRPLSRTPSHDSLTRRPIPIHNTQRSTRRLGGPHHPLSRSKTSSAPLSSSYILPPMSPVGVRNLFTPRDDQDCHASTAAGSEPLGWSDHPPEVLTGLQPLTFPSASFSPSALSGRLSSPLHVGTAHSGNATPTSTAGSPEGRAPRGSPPPRPHSFSSSPKASAATAAAAGAPSASSSYSQRPSLDTTSLQDSRLSPHVCLVGVAPPSPAQLAAPYQKSRRANPTPNAAPSLRTWLSASPTHATRVTY